MIITDADRQMLPLSLRQASGFHLAAKWYLAPGGNTDLGWVPLPYQWAWHQLQIMNTSLVTGIAAGKTTVVAASNLIDCTSIPYFRALNTSVTAKQAELPFEMAMMWIEGNPHLEHLIDDIILRPYPIISFKNFSQYEFRTAGSDARFIRGFEYDRINYDESGLDYLGSVIKVLRGRLRGRRPDGTIRMGRLDVTTSPTAALWLRERFYRGIKGDPTADLKRYISQRVSTYDNTYLTREQIEAMEAEYPPEMIDVELGGNFPDYGISMFPTSHIQACTDQSLYDAAYIALFPETGKPLSGYQLYEDPRHGVIHFELPVEPGRTYISAGDPGIDNLPKRNAGVVIVSDITTKPYRVVYFHWISGKGSFNPFLASYRYAIDKYSPVLRGIDATGTQQYVNEIAFENNGIETDKLSFSSDKYGMLNNLSMDVSNHNWAWPPIAGLLKQMGTYSPEGDRLDKKLPQDIVMTLAGISYLSRSVPEKQQGADVARANYRDRRARSSSRPRRA